MSGRTVQGGILGMEKTRERYVGKFRGWELVVMSLH